MSEPYLRGTTYYVDLYSTDQHGEKHRVRKSTGKKTLAEALKAAEKIKAEWEDWEKAVERKVTLEAVLDDMITHKKTKQKSDATVRFYEQKKKSLIAFFGADFKVKTINARNVERYIAQRQENKISQNTIHKELIALRTALKIAKTHGLWSGDVTRVMPVGEAPKYKPRERYLTPDELWKLMKELEPKKAIMVAWMVATSARWSEAVSTQAEDIFRMEGKTPIAITDPDEVDLNGDAVIYARLRGTKTEAAFRVVPLVAPWQRMLVKFILEGKKKIVTSRCDERSFFEPWLPWNANRDIKRACARAKIDPCSPNDLRRTHASYLYQAGVPDALIAKNMGHKTTHMVQLVYGRTTPEMVGVGIAHALKQSPISHELQPLQASNRAPRGMAARVARQRIIEAEKAAKKVKQLEAAAPRRDPVPSVPRPVPTATEHPEDINPDDPWSILAETL